MLKDTLKLLREERGLTKKQLADEIGIKERAYMTYEYGQRDVSTELLQKFADYFGVTTDYLLGRPDEKPLEDLKEGDTVHWYEILKTLREKSGESMSKTAEFLGIPKGTYASYEYGKREPNIEMILKISDHFGVAIDYLLGGKSAETPEDTIKRLAKQYQMTDAQTGIVAAYFYMNEENREKLLEIVRTFADGADAAESKESREKFEKVKVAAYQNPAGSIPREAEYPQELLDDMDKNAPLTDPDM